MGIPYYYTHLIKKYNTILKEFSNNSKSNVILFIDANSLIYESCVDLKDEDLIIKGVIEKIKHLIAECNSKFTYIAFDGLPPYAKIQQQRTRRYKSSLTKRLLKTNDESKWDTCAITPGTLFMEKVNTKLKNIFSAKTKYFFSGSDVEGEGEHKIFEYIRANKEIIKKNKNNLVVYGLDADLIMLSLHHLKHVKNIMLYRETPSFIRSVNVNMDPNKQYLLDIKELAGTINIPIDDYLILGFFMGNDFLPHFPSLNIREKGLEKIIEIYTKTINKERNLTDPTNGQIIWENVRIMVAELAKEEHNELKQHHTNKLKQKKPFCKSNEDYLMNMPFFDRKLETSINPYDENWKFLYYKKLFDVDIRENKIAIKKICINFLEGLEWNYKYYSGFPINWNWDYKYNYPPLFEDLYNHMPFYGIEFINEEASKFTPMKQLEYVLPFDSLHLLPKSRLAQLSMEHYSTDCELVWAYCKYFWEAHVIWNDVL